MSVLGGKGSRECEVGERVTGINLGNNTRFRRDGGARIKKECEISAFEIGVAGGR